MSAVKQDMTLRCSSTTRRADEGPEANGDGRDGPRIMDLVDGRARDAADSGLHSPDGQLLLSERGKDLVGKNWVRRFVGRHDEIKAKYSKGE